MSSKLSAHGKQAADRERPDRQQDSAEHQPAQLPVPLQRFDMASAPISPQNALQLQRLVGNHAVGGIIRRKGDYAYGSANTVPHIHVYGGDSHLKIVDRGRVRRYNIIQNGKRHGQADDALAAAAGNQTLLDAINGLL